MSFLIICAGFPATTQLSSTSFVTTEPAPTTELTPMVTPESIMLPDPIQALFLM